MQGNQFSKKAKSDILKSMKKIEIVEYFEEVETEQEYNGYYYSVAEAISIAVLGSLCGLKNASQIHQWAEDERVREFLKENFSIERIPCYYWFLSLLKLIKPDSLNQCLRKWVQAHLPKDRHGLTLAVDGKTVRSTEKMQGYDSPLHIISAQLSELGMTFASKSVSGKSNEIPAVQDLLRELDIEGCLVVADALNCQKETAKVITAGKSDYLLDVKDNQPRLKQDIAEYVQDDHLRKTMESACKKEKSRDRIETRTAFVTTDISWLEGRKAWANMACIGAICAEFEKKGQKTSEWHYYISSRPLTGQELLHHARMEWAVESMHWLLDVHYGEDFCRVANKTIQLNLNMLRKFSLNLIKQYKSRTSSKKALSKIMFDCLLDPDRILPLTSEN